MSLRAWAEISMPRFVLLYHDCPPDYVRPSHWDLMLECGDVLRTWVLQELPRDWTPIVAQTTRSAGSCPAAAATNQVAAEHLNDHRHEYLSHEGPVSGGRGTVTRVEEGTYVVEHESSDRWRIQLNGQSICGDATLVKALAEPVAPRSVKTLAEPAALNDWRLTFQPDSSIA
jgi:DNA polymerase Ligase (LigD)